MIQHWEVNRCISLRTKIFAISSMFIVGGASLSFGIEDFRLKIAALSLMLIGGVVILRIKTCGQGDPVQSMEETD